jgi:hypothetical protein
MLNAEGSKGLMQARNRRDFYEDPCFIIDFLLSSEKSFVLQKGSSPNLLMSL